MAVHSRMRTAALDGRQRCFDGGHKMQIPSYLCGVEESSLAVLTRRWGIVKHQYQSIWMFSINTLSTTSGKSDNNGLIIKHNALFTITTSVSVSYNFLTQNLETQYIYSFWWRTYEIQTPFCGCGEEESLLVVLITKWVDTDGWAIVTSNT